MKKYFFPCLLFLANSEIISLLALLIMAGMFLWDLACARIGERADRHDQFANWSRNDRREA